MNKYKLLLSLLFLIYHTAKPAPVHISIPTKDTTTIHANCSEKKLKNEDSQDPIIVKTCYLKNCRFVSTGYPDRKGRYSWDYELYKKTGQKYVKAMNEEIFNTQQNELLKILNKRVEKDFLQYSTDADTKDCFSDKTYSGHTLNDFKISFEGDQIWFSVYFGLPGACRNVDGSFVIFKLREIQKYLK